MLFTIEDVLFGMAYASDCCNAPPKGGLSYDPGLGGLFGRQEAHDQATRKGKCSKCDKVTGFHQAHSITGVESGRVKFGS